ncbi:hypothetical protein [Pseudoalteromonas ulvae]|uniref:Uncharacterized protein n=1 Tax=Pseudoalteromonas ulvae TaxID=107327 RepID=A0A244CUH8_PSEDV|nr:hypothetical protein [Pseudoalteromonas ulvae]OUL59280.1 hypothetical protein B1199_03145 [Pseudoalteromonas ulvae]
MPLALFRITIAIAAIYIGYWFYDFYQEVLPSMYLSIADHITHNENSRQFSMLAYQSMKDNKITDKEFQELAVLAIKESGKFKIIETTSYSREQAKLRLKKAL